jgi:hypothetical protein
MVTSEGGLRGGTHGQRERRRGQLRAALGQGAARTGAIEEEGATVMRTSAGEEARRWCSALV